VLIFHLLFVGRHPFAGRFLGSGEMTIEKAIAERRFAFSKSKSATQMEPPPASLLLDDIPPSLGELFERAFRSDPGVNTRPTAVEWAEQLDALIGQRRVCSFDQAHVYYSNLRQCPWCRIEDEGGPAFFVQDGSVSLISPQRLTHLEDKLKRLTVPEFPTLSPQQLKIPQAIGPKRLETRTPLAKTDMAAALLVAASLACVAGVLSAWALLAGAVAAAASGAFLLFSKEARARRATVDQLQRRLAEIQHKLYQRTRQISSAHQKRLQTFEESLSELRAERDHYRAADTHLQDVLVLYRTTQKNRFLSTHLIQDYAAQIPGMNSSMASVLQSYGIESALDIDPIKLVAIPMLSPGLTLELRTWRDRIDRQFVFKSEHGINIEDKNAAGKDAVNRFKVVQARRILMGARQLEILVANAREELVRELNHYERQCELARAVAKELRDVQSARRRWERAINSSWPAVAGVTLAAPAGGLLLWLMFG